MDVFFIWTRGFFGNVIMYAYGNINNRNSDLNSGMFDGGGLCRQRGRGSNCVRTKMYGSLL